MVSWKLNVLLLTSSWKGLSSPWPHLEDILETFVMNFFHGG